MSGQVLIGVEVLRKLEARLAEAVKKYDELKHVVECNKQLLSENDDLRLSLADAEAAAFTGWAAATGYPIAEWVYGYHPFLRAYKPEEKGGHMTTLGLKLSRTGDHDSVCHHSGLTRQDCDYLCLCHNCGQSFVPCPSRAEIYKRAEELRQTWPTSRLDKQELREWEMDIPESTRVWDHMRRKQDGDQQR